MNLKYYDKAKQDFLEVLKLDPNNKFATTQVKKLTKKIRK